MPRTPPRSSPPRARPATSASRPGCGSTRRRPSFRGSSSWSPTRRATETPRTRLIEILLRHSPDVLRMSIDEASMNLAGTPDLRQARPRGRRPRRQERDPRRRSGNASPARSGSRPRSGWPSKPPTSTSATGCSGSTTPTSCRCSSGWSSPTCPASPRRPRARLRKAGIQTVDRLPVRHPGPAQPRGHAIRRRQRLAPAPARVRGRAASRAAARKSYSHSHVLARATTSQVELEELLMRLSDMVGRRAARSRTSRQRGFDRRRVPTGRRPSLQAIQARRRRSQPAMRSTEPR